MTSKIVANRTIAFCLAGAESPLKYPMTLHNYDELVRTNLRQIFTLLTWQSGESTQTPQFIQIRIRIWPSNVLKLFSKQKCLYYFRGTGHDRLLFTDRKSGDMPAVLAMLQVSCRSVVWNVRLASVPFYCSLFPLFYIF